MKRFSIIPLAVLALTASACKAPTGPLIVCFTPCVDDKNSAPQPPGFGGVWGSSATDVWAVGGTILIHYDGNTWSAQASGTAAQLFGVWGSSATDVFAVGGGGTILHYDGNTWSAQASGTTGTLFGVWGSSATDVFAVGGDSTILHYDGTNWR